MALEVLFTDTSRKVVGNLMILIMLTLMFIGGVFLVFALYVGKEMIVLKVFLVGYKVSTLYWMLIFCGSFMVFYLLLGCKIVHSCLTPKNRPKCHVFMFPFNVFLIIFLVVELVVSLMCLAEVGKISAAFSEGIGQAVKDYSKDKDIKQHIDNIQLNYDCCGEKDYTDWFSSEWILPKYVTPNMAPASASVPFSCCDATATRPCVNENVHTATAGYDPAADITIYTTGCTEALVNSKRFSGLAHVGKMGLVGFGLLFCLVFLFRYYQTNITQAVEWGDPSRASYGYLVNFMGAVEEPPEAHRRPSSIIAEREAAAAERGEKPAEEADYEYDDEYGGMRKKKKKHKKKKRERKTRNQAFTESRRLTKFERSDADKLQDVWDMRKGVKL